MTERMIDALPGLLRGLYTKSGYSRYRTVGFEEYDLFTEYRDFLTSGQMITFTGAGGRLLALKPDVTLSIIKNIKTYKGCTEKVYYNENVYRAASDSHELTEIMQTGLECIGHLDLLAMGEVIALADESLALIHSSYLLNLSHIGILSDLLENLEDRQQRLKALCKTTDGFKIAEEDLKLRGPGDFFGSRQSGLPTFKVANLSYDLTTLKDAQKASAQWIDREGTADTPEGRNLRRRIATLFARAEGTIN